MPGQLARDPVAQVLERELRHRVDRLAGDSLRDRKVGGDVHHAPTAALDHGRQHGLEQHHRPTQVHLHDQVEALERRLQERSRRTDARVVHQNIDPAVLGQRPLRQRAHLTLIAHVGGNDQDRAPERPNLRCRFLQRAGQPGRAPPRGDHQVRALPRERERRGIAHAPARAGNQHHLTREGTVRGYHARMCLSCSVMLMSAEARPGSPACQNRSRTRYRADAATGDDPICENRISGMICAAITFLAMLGVPPAIRETSESRRMR